MAQAFIESPRTHMLPLELGRFMPVIARGETRAPRPDSEQSRDSCAGERR